MFRRAVAIIMLSALTGCATPESRVRSALLNAGLSRPVATCMAQHMVDRLTLAQLQRLSQMSSLGQRKIGDLSINELMHKARAIGDPKIITVIATAGIGCSIAA